MVRERTFVDHDACGVGFVAQLGSTGSREVVKRALEALRRLDRGGVDADGRSGDSAGLLIRIPEKFFRRATPGVRRRTFREFLRKRLPIGDSESAC